MRLAGPLALSKLPRRFARRANLPQSGSLISPPNQQYIPCRLVPKEGRFAIVTNAGRDAVDADRASDEGAFCGRRSRVVLTPRRWRQVGGSDSAGDGGNKARLTGESTI
jgi:hypothetical protein